MVARFCVLSVLNFVTAIVGNAKYVAPSVVVVKTRFNGIANGNFFSKDLLAVTIVFVVIVRREF